MDTADFGDEDSTVSVSDLGPNYEALDYQGSPRADSFFSKRKKCSANELNVAETFYRSIDTTYEDEIDRDLGIPPHDWDFHAANNLPSDDTSVLWRGKKILDLHRVSDEDDNIVNCVQLHRSSWTGLHRDSTALYAACNDHTVSQWDLEGRLNWRLTLPWCANHLSISPTSRLICIGADCKRVFLYDTLSAKPVMTLEGHEDYTFSSTWHPDPNSYMVATGNQDNTCRIWDIRSPSQSLFCLASACSAIRCVQFSPDGQSLAFGETKDLVFLYDVRSQFQQYDWIDFFGEPTGISFSPDSSRFFVGIAEPTYGGVLELRKGNPFHSICKANSFKVDMKSTSAAKLKSKERMGRRVSDEAIADNFEQQRPVPKCDNWLQAKLCKLLQVKAFYEGSLSANLEDDQFDGAGNQQDKEISLKSMVYESAMSEVVKIMKRFLALECSTNNSNLFDDIPEAMKANSENQSKVLDQVTDNFEVERSGDKASKLCATLEMPDPLRRQLRPEIGTTLTALYRTWLGIRAVVNPYPPFSTSDLLVTFALPDNLSWLPSNIVPARRRSDESDEKKWVHQLPLTSPQLSQQSSSIDSLNQNNFSLPPATSSQMKSSYIDIERSLIALLAQGAETADIFGYWAPTILSAEQEATLNYLKCRLKISRRLQE